MGMGVQYRPKRWIGFRALSGRALRNRSGATRVQHQSSPLLGTVFRPFPARTDASPPARRIPEVPVTTSSTSSRCFGFLNLAKTTTCGRKMAISSVRKRRSLTRQMNAILGSPRFASADRDPLRQDPQNERGLAFQCDSG